MSFDAELRFALERGRPIRGELVEPAHGDRLGEADELARELHELEARAKWRELCRRDHARLLKLRRWRADVERGRRAAGAER